MKIKDGFAKRKIADSIIVVPVGETAKEFNGMITLNETGSFFWDCFISETTVDEAIAKLLAEYNIDEATAKKDIDKFVDMLKDNDLLD